MSHQLTGWCFALTLVAVAGIAMWQYLGSTGPATPATSVEHALPSEARGVQLTRIPAGQFVATDSGNQRLLNDPQERIDQFQLAVHEITRAQFARFVVDTGYITTAERRGTGRVFQLSTRQWLPVAGADWRHPLGPEQEFEGRDQWPVVQVSWYDAVAFARWAGGELPSATQWKYAARGGLIDARFPWGSEEKPLGQYQANYWQDAAGDNSPGRPSPGDGYVLPAPVGRFPPNRYGLSDMAGNVREWCRDEVDGRRIVHGGSWLSTAADRSLHVAVSQQLAPEYSDDQTGFRITVPVEQ